MTNADIQQVWEDESFCRNYAEERSISTQEAHYGWLADGEATLGLMGDIDLKTATVLDLGCGMGENLIALYRKGAICFGVDISPYMLEFASEKVANELGSNSTIQFERQDMRELTAFAGVQFDLVISIYSLEYLRNLQEFRAISANIFSRLRDNGTFIFCFSHPLQHHKHLSLGNFSASVGEVANAPFIYSFRDVVAVLSDTGFMIDRIVEQGTKNPSRITHDAGKLFPYNFSQGKNPCDPKFDSISNEAPHTVIYKCRKAKTPKRKTAQKSLSFEKGKVFVWGQNRTISCVATVGLGANRYEVYNFVRKDSVVGLCRVLKFRTEADDTRDRSDIHIPTYKNGIRTVNPFNAKSLLGMVFRRLEREGLVPICQTEKWPDPAKSAFSEATYIQRVDPLFGELNGLFPQQNLGLLVFVNGQEPGSGKVAADRIFPVINDEIEVVYAMTDWGWDWRRKEAADSQLELF